MTKLLVVLSQRTSLFLVTLAILALKIICINNPNDDFVLKNFVNHQLPVNCSRRLDPKAQTDQLNHTFNGEPISSKRRVCRNVREAMSEATEALMEAAVEIQTIVVENTPITTVATSVILNATLIALEVSNDLSIAAANATNPTVVLSENGSISEQGLNVSAAAVSQNSTLIKKKTSAAMIGIWIYLSLLAALALFIIKDCKQWFTKFDDKKSLAFSWRSLGKGHRLGWGKSTGGKSQSAGSQTSANSSFSSGTFVSASGSKDSVSLENSYKK